MTEVTADLFERAINQEIQVRSAAGVEPWRVLSVKRLPGHQYRQHPFAAYLAAPADSQPAQGERSAVFAGGEEVSFFAVPIEANRDAVNYEVIYN